MAWTHRCAELFVSCGGCRARRGRAAPDSQSELEGVDPPSSEGRDEEEEGAAAAGLRVPEGPGEAEKCNHERTHLPYHLWCDAVSWAEQWVGSIAGGVLILIGCPSSNVTISSSGLQKEMRTGLAVVHRQSGEGAAGDPRGVSPGSFRSAGIRTIVESTAAGRPS